ncbi:hypothetical protein SALBM311S_05549 [Streptomyces alboniger]
MFGEAVGDAVRAGPLTGGAGQPAEVLEEFVHQARRLFRGVEEWTAPDASATTASSRSAHSPITGVG